MKPEELVQLLDGEISRLKVTYYPLSRLIIALSGQPGQHTRQGHLDQQIRGG